MDFLRGLIIVANTSLFTCSLFLKLLTLKLWFQQRWVSFFFFCLDSGQTEIFALADQVLFPTQYRLEAAREIKSNTPAPCRYVCLCVFVCVCARLYSVEKCIYDSKASLESLVSLCCCISDDWTTTRGKCRGCRNEVMKLRKTWRMGRKGGEGGENKWSLRHQCHYRIMTTSQDTLSVFIIKQNKLKPTLNLQVY